jgi:multisubunit Na+/H+ antiporter MnhB subunit
MNYVALQAAVWIAAGFLLVMLVMRRRKHRQRREN